MFKRIVLIGLIGVLSSLGLNSAVCANTLSKPSLSPVGYWITLDHKNHNAQSSVIQITQAPDGEVSGAIVHIFEEQGHTAKDKCVLCKGPLHNAPILGLKIVWGFHQDPSTPGQYSDGFVLDPTNGKTYHCHMWLSQNNNQLTVHGYIGISLIGRSDVWFRARLVSGKTKIAH
jgi:uncharacterized protein (DUF2147 family)